MANSTGRRRAAYKDFLQPALHRRFGSAALAVVAIAYVEALLLATWGDSYLWPWFPIGPAGIKTLALFACGLSVLVLRIAQYHVDVRTSNSTFHAFLRDVVRVQSYEPFIFYGLSSLVHYIIYRVTYSDNTDLHWIVYRNGDRARLNEKTIFLSTYLFSCAVVQAVKHIFNDEDRLSLDPARVEAAKGNKDGGDVPSAMGQAVIRLAGIIMKAVTTSVATFFLHGALYYCVFRSFAWTWALFFLRRPYSLPKTNALPASGPITYSTFKHCLVSGTLLFTIWGVANVAFSIFMAREPLKNGKPLTAESKDPNGSLLNGLKSPRPAIRSYAMWELDFIARDFEDRRRAIFEDIDRKDGPMWSQVYTICLDVVKSIGARIDDYEKKPAPAAAPAEAKPELKRTSSSVKDDAIYRRQTAPKSMRSEVVDRVIEHVTRDPGQTPMSRLSPVAKKTFKKARDTVLSKDQQDALKPENVAGQAQQLLVRLLKNEWVGGLFRQTWARRITAAALGTPSAELVRYIHAIDVLGLLAVKSLSEDKYGNVHRDVPSIIRAFTATIRKLEAFKASFPLHWTDVDGTKEAPEVEAVLGALKGSLRSMVSEFEPYRNDLRLSLTDIRLAKEAAGVAEENGKGKGPEMVEARR